MFGINRQTLVETRTKTHIQNHKQKHRDRLTDRQIDITSEGTETKHRQRKGKTE